MAVSVESRVKDLIAEQLGLEEGEFSVTDSIVGDLGADSVDIAALIMTIEEEFEIEISDEDAEKIATVKDAVDYVRKNL